MANPSESNGGQGPGVARTPDMARLSATKLIVLDVDGVMTDGSIMASESSGEIFRFNVKDGAGIVLARKAGIEVGILTGRSSSVVERRARDLGITRLLQGAMDKGAGLRDLLSDGVYRFSETAYMGDDVLDLPAIRMSGFSACPRDAHPLVVKRADYVCRSPGGGGAVREFIDLLLEAKGLLEGLEQRFWEGPGDAQLP
jgi:3-deoxy-D-manno-octulosonate 8-phosphate phosphatase (KDO 8-P phosphatase)